MPPKGKRFQPGQSGNPSGRPKLADGLKLVHGLCSEEVRLTIAQYFRMSRDELTRLKEDPDLPALDHAIVSGALNASKGDLDAMRFYLERTIGKVKDQLEVTKDENHDADLAEIPRDVRLQLLREKV